MKKLLFLFLSLIFLSMFTSCNKDNNTTPTQVSTTQFIKFKCNGIQYEFDNPIVENSSFKVIKATKPNDKSFELYTQVNLPVGTYPIQDSFSGNVATANISINSIGLSNGGATSGELKVTSVTGNNIKGTFNFAFSKNSIDYNVTEGSFNVGN